MKLGLYAAWACSILIPPVQAVDFGVMILWFCFSIVVFGWLHQKELG